MSLTGFNLRRRRLARQEQSAKQEAPIVKDEAPVAETPAKTSAEKSDEKAEVKVAELFPRGNGKKKKNDD